MSRKLIRNILMGIAASLMAAAIALRFQGPNAALIIFGIGIFIMLIALAIGKKREVPSVSPTIPPVHQENKQTIIQQANPQQTVSIYHDSRISAADKENRRHEEMVLACMKRIHPDLMYDVKEIAKDLQLAKSLVWHALERLEIKGHVRRIRINEATEGFMWTLTDLER